MGTGDAGSRRRRRDADDRSMPTDVLARLLDAVRATPACAADLPDDPLCAVGGDHDAPGVCYPDCEVAAVENRVAALARSTWTEVLAIVDQHPETIDAVRGLRAALAAAGALVPESARRDLIKVLAAATGATAALDPDSWVTSAEAARMLGVTVRTLRRWRDAGTAPPWTQVGGLIRFRVGDVQAHLEAGKVASTAEQVARGRR